MPVEVLLEILEENTEGTKKFFTDASPCFSTSHAGIHTLPPFQSRPRAAPDSVGWRCNIEDLLCVGHVAHATSYAVFTTEVDILLSSVLR